MNNLKEKKLKARINYLNQYDLINFSNVPDFIVNAFFDTCTYKSRVIVSSFGFLNGLDSQSTIKLCHHRDIKELDKQKIIALFEYYKHPENAFRYYSYSIIERVVMFLNGDLRTNGKRVINKGRK